MRAILRFLQRDDGPTAVEYAIMLALILGLCLIGINAMVTATGKSFEGSGNKIEEAIANANGAV